MTLQTLKMVSADLEQSSVDQRCAIAGQLLDALAAIPTAYIAAISATFVSVSVSLSPADPPTAASSRQCWSPARKRHSATSISVVIPPSPQRHSRHGRSDIGAGVVPRYGARYLIQAQVARLHH